MEIPHLFHEALCQAHGLLVPVCQSWMQATPLNYFGVWRFYDTGQCRVVSLMPSYIEQVISLALFPSFSELAQFYHRVGRRVLLSKTLSVTHTELNQINADKRESSIALAGRHGIYHRMCLLTRCEDYFELAVFGVSDEKTSVIEFYLNSLPMLEQFARQCERTLFPQLTIKGVHHELFLPGYCDTSLMEVTLSHSPPSFQPLQTLTLNNGKVVTFSDQEWACLCLRLQHYSSRMIADRLDLSARTVDAHIHHVKKKLGESAMYRIRELVEQNQWPLLKKQ